MNHHFRALLPGIAAALLAACGGGGGGGSGEAPATGITAANGYDMATATTAAYRSVLSATTLALGGHYSASAVPRLRARDAAATLPCSGGGSSAVELADADGNGLVDRPGESLLLTFTRCATGEADAAVVLDGTTRLTVAEAAANDPAGDWRLTATVEFSHLSISSAAAATVLAGSARAAFAYTAARAEESVDILADAVVGTAAGEMTLKEFAIGSVFQLAQDSGRLTVNGAVGTPAGDLTLATAQPLAFAGDAPPHDGATTLTDPAGAVATVSYHPGGATVSVDPNGDGRPEAAREMPTAALRVGMVDPMGSGPTVAFATTTASVQEGDVGQSVVELTVTMAAAQQYPVAVYYRTRATDDEYRADTRDYLDLPDSSYNHVVFWPGETTKTLSIWVVGDPEVEHDEPFEVELMSVHTLGASNAPIIGAVTDIAVVTIINDDTVNPPGTGSCGVQVRGPDHPYDEYGTHLRYRLDGSESGIVAIDFHSLDDSLQGYIRLRAYYGEMLKLESTLFANNMDRTLTFRYDYGRDGVARDLTISVLGNLEQTQDWWSYRVRCEGGVE